jgi:hypothetical protein
MSIQEKEELIAELTEHINQVHECMKFHNPLANIPLDALWKMVEEYHSTVHHDSVLDMMESVCADYNIIKQIRNINGDNYDKTNHP